MGASGTGESSIAALADGVRRGELRAVARAISVAEEGGHIARVLADRLHAAAGGALTIGVTGPPGAGKSTLVDRLVAEYRRAGRRVGVLAIDPSSAFSGGALLGDRVRMQDHALDADVFIRSMATRGHLGGLSAAALAATDVLAAAGFDVVLIETVGVGQDEGDVARVADVCVVVLVPAMGDEVQALKAGVMEIADIFVVNKADTDGADRAVAIVEQMLSLGEASAAPAPPVLRVVATTGEGVGELFEVVAQQGADERRRHARRQERAEWRVLTLLREIAVASAQHRPPDGDWSALMGLVASGQRSAYDVAMSVLGMAAAEAVLDHVGIATAHVDASLAFFAATLGLRVGLPEDVASQGVRVRFVESGQARIELVEALDPASAFARSLTRRGPGLHHIAFRVADLPATLDRLAGAGVRLVDRQGRPGAHGTTVAFVHPSATQGVLIELVEPSRD